MKKKKWYCCPLTKGILLVLQYVFLGTAIFSGLFFLALEIQGGLRLSDNTGNYFDSSSFTNTFYNNTWDIMHAVSGVLGTSGTSTESNEITDFSSLKDTDVIDIDEVLNNKTITGKNTSGLAYSLDDLKNWINITDYDADDGQPIVVCLTSDSSDNTSQLSRHYYRADDFLKKLDTGEFSLTLNPDSYQYSNMYSDYYAADEEDFFQEIKEEIRYGTLDEEFASGIHVQSVNAKDGSTLYDYIYSYQGYNLTEHFAPEGADSILDILNTNAYWNGHIEDAFTGLSSLLSKIEFLDEEEQVLDSYSLDASNMTYLYINEDAGKVISNDDELVNNELKYTDNNLSDSSTDAVDYYTMLQNILSKKSNLSYILIQAKPESFTSNLKSLTDYHFGLWGSGITSSSWQSVAQTLLPRVNDNYIFAAYVDQDLLHNDAFTVGKTVFDSYSGFMKPVFFLCILSVLLFLIALIWLTVAAGRSNADEELHLCFFDRWYTEISAGLVLLFCFPVLLMISRLVPLASYQIERLHYTLMDNYLFLPLLGIGSYTLFWFQIGYLSLVRRIKSKSLWKNSLLRKILHFLWKVLCKISLKFHELGDFYSRNTASKVKATVAFLGFILLKYIFCVILLNSGAMLLFFSLLVDLGILFFVIRSAAHRDILITGLKEISNGNLQYKIPLERLLGDEKIMAEYINNIGSGLDAAVENSVKNERMKTELITNVSHDLKTPLTSIISYIDLLKRENFTDPKICEYLDILEEKAARLKVLTEDVVEASKASTGNLTLNMADIDFIEMLHQVIGEFEERFQEHQLTMMVHFPDESSIIHADGQRMWRVLENIFGNVTKYAMEGTRVYAEVQNSHNQVLFSLKNISAQPLNFAAEELTERFVRGDVARNTEGSGLGLSIAKSLTELQGGKFQLYLDGDLFKVTITFQAQNTKQKTQGTDYVD